MKTEKLTYIIYNKKSIPIVSEGWNKIGGYYYRELNTSEGIIFTNSISYKLR
jgi:hypothetical protein